MPVPDFQGDTFVAFIDISGFKEMMKSGDSIAMDTLNKFYQAGFNSLNNNTDISGFFISDCGILFVNNNELRKIRKLKIILEVVKEINKKLLSKNIILTTSIAYGKFNYQQRIEFSGISKNPIYGDAYISAFMDNENGKPKIQPGKCRVVSNNDSDDYLEIPLLRQVKKHFYYYWMCDDISEINNFEKEYKNSYKLKYSGMISALKGNND